MITRHDDSTWQANPSMPIHLLPTLVERVAIEDGEYLIYYDKDERNRVIIKEALKYKRLAERYALIASSFIEFDQINANCFEKSMMQRAAKEGGKFFFLYCSALRIFGPRKNYPPEPVSIKAFPELKEDWDDGFYTARRYLYHFSD